MSGKNKGHSAKHTAATAKVAATEVTAQGSLTNFKLDDNASGVSETVANIVSVTVVSKDYSRPLRAEYRAGFVQGNLQKASILSARDNTWDQIYLLSPSNPPGAAPAPKSEDMKESNIILLNNYYTFLNTLRSWTIDPAHASDATAFKRLLFRMLGIYHGATKAAPDEKLDFSGAWLPDKSYFTDAELTLNYNSKTLSFMDVYYLNATNDLGDVKDHLANNAHGSESCSAFFKRTDGGMILTHNTWQGFLSQTMVVTLAVNDDLLTMNAASPGLIGSNTDFGFNNKGIMFNETTHRLSKNEARANAMWIFWRATAAEQFAASLDDFFHYITLDNSASYLNGYMVADVKNGESGLIEMSYRCFVCYRSKGGDYEVSGWSLDGGPCAVDYDKQMITADYLMGINFPASLQVRGDLKSTDNRPARRWQFMQLLPTVSNVDTAKLCITYTDPGNPLSLFGRWDLGYGETLYPKTIPDGSIDSKVVSEATVRAFMNLGGKLDTKSTAKGFWMLYGTPHINKEPFIWSTSAWKAQPLRDVPDRLDGEFTEMNLYLS